MIELYFPAGLGLVSTNMLIFCYDLFQKFSQNALSRTNTAKTTSVKVEKQPSIARRQAGGARWNGQMDWPPPSSVQVQPVSKHF